MTVEEMFQLLLNKIDSLDKKIDATHAELKADIARVEAKADANHNKLLEAVVNLHVDLIDIKERTDKQQVELKTYRRSTQTTINDIQLRQDNLEDEVEEIKKKLDRAS